MAEFHKLTIGFYSDSLFLPAAFLVNNHPSLQM